MPTPRVIPAGVRYGRQVVLTAREHGERRLHVRCDCGTEHAIDVYTWGRVKSCGCLRKELVGNLGKPRAKGPGRPPSKRHGLSHTPEYSSWSAMIDRTTNPRNGKWENYGGRGITVCDRWRNFLNFLADMGARPEGTTLDRINNDGNYEPGNCRWATWHQQANNRRPRRAIRPPARWGPPVPYVRKVTSDGRSPDG